MSSFMDGNSSRKLPHSYSDHTFDETASFTSRNTSSIGFQQHNRLNAMYQNKNPLQYTSLSYLSQNALSLFDDLEAPDFENDRSFEHHTSSGIDIDKSRDMDKSIASLQQSLADMRVKPVSDKFNEDSINTDFDTTREQLKRDLKLDTSDTSSRTASIPKRSVSSSPWRKLRSTPLPAPANLPPAPQLRFNSPDVLRNNRLDASSNADTISELNKQLTGYKIQIRFFKQFLQKLIEKRELNQNDLDLTELTQLHDKLSPMERITSNTSNNEYLKLETEHKALSKSYDELFSLNNDLYANLEQFQKTLEEREQELADIKRELYDYNLLVNQIIQTIISDTDTDLISRKALLKCLESTSLSSIEVKLQAVQMELSKRAESARESKRNSFNSSSSGTAVDREKQYEINNYIKTIHQLMSALEQLRNEFDDQNKLVDRMKIELNNEVEQSEQLRANNTLMKQNIDMLSDMIDQTTASLADVSETQSLHSENNRLRALNETLNHKFEEYQQIIDHLQEEVKQIQRISVHDPNTSELKEELLHSHQDFNKLQEEYNDLHQKYVKLKENSSSTVSSLTNQLNQTKNESSSLKAGQAIQQRMEQELNLAVEKQRILKAEKIRLTYKVDSLTKDKISLQTTIQNLTDKITDLTVADNQGSKSDEDSFKKKINVLEYQIAELLKIDTLKFQKLLKSFNKIADDVSLKEPSRKVDYMAQKLLPNNVSSDSFDGVDFSDMNLIKENHKSVFDYFTRAVDVVVNDHVKLLLKESDHDMNSSEYISKLHQRIDELNKLNDDLLRLVDASETLILEYSDSSSPRAKLRIDELTRRWKAEREARVYEHNEAERRLKELELENDRLRNQLSSTV